MKAIVNATLIDGTGADPVSGASILVDDDGRIESVGPNVTTPRGVDVIDASGRTVMPGMIDAHVHFMITRPGLVQRVMAPPTLHLIRAVRNAIDTLNAGITSVRDVGGASAGFRMAADEGLFAAPRMKLAIVLVSQTGGHGDTTLPSGIEAQLWSGPEWPSRVMDGPDEVRKGARELFRAGADLIKMCTTGGVLSPSDEVDAVQFTREEISIMVEEARMHGKATAAHAQGTEGIRNAVECGVNSIEHWIYITEEIAVEMIRRGTFLVPTFSATRGVLKAEEENPGSILPQSLRKAHQVMADHNANIKMAYEKGVKIAMGTDAGVSKHGVNAEELEHMVNITGMSPMEAIVARQGRRLSVFARMLMPARWNPANWQIFWSSMAIHWRTSAFSRTGRSCCSSCKAARPAKT